MAQLIAAGKSGKALDLCKDIHHRRQSADSEALLLEAYGARFRTLLERNLEFEAKNLVALVSDRYPAAISRLAEWNSVLAARQGDLNALLAPLNNPSLPPERHAAISAAVRRDVVDLPALAGCRVLTPEHPLRIAAAALSKAFDAVTSGPVAEETLALLEVSRQNPLAPWKMLVRAIAQYYRRDDAMCEKYLDAVESDSAAARLTPALRALMHQKELHKSQTLTPAASALVSRTGGNLEKLRDILKALDQALDRRKKAQIIPEIRNAVTVCQQWEPRLLERMKQHISVRAMLAGLEPESVTTAMQGPSLRNAYFWRLLARAHEEQKDNHPAAIPTASSLWEEFRKHAIHEGWFPAQGPEVAALYLHIADLWHMVSPESVEDLREGFAAHYRGQADYYRGQPPEIRALMPRHDNPDLYFLWPFGALERACQADPCSENFQRWLRCAVDTASDRHDDVAERWSQALPLDIPPMLHLMESAEKRNALKKAFNYMERAEQIDGLNSDVRRARLRLLVSMAIRHLKDRKARLAEGELRQLEALPQAQQGDRPALVSALRWAWSLSGGPPPSAQDARAEVVRLLGSELAAQIVFAGVSRQCGMRLTEPAGPPKGVQLSSAIGRACALGDDMGMPFEIPRNLFDRLEKELSAKGFSAPVVPLLALGEAAIRQDLFKMAYAIAGAGLAQGPEGQARFLYLRARGLPPGDRRTECLRAASELARRRRDSDLLDKIGEWRDEEMDWLDDPPDANTATISAEEIARVVDREARERGYPEWQPDDGVLDEDGCPCPACRARRGDLDMPPELENMLEQFGPEVVAQALAEIVGMGGFGAPGGKRKRRKRRNPFLDDSDVLPF
ncbi:MAG TPA: hypothetical protein VGZ73_26960 [Bryobacteraceae bacterium]|nr:hypothetical protein [Bryobacteraceae bacterium]